MLPSAWTYTPISAFTHPTDQTVQTGPFGAQLHSDDYVDEGVPFILIRNMVRGGVDDSDMPRILPKDAERLSNYKLKLNDIVFSRVGRVGSCFLVGQDQVGWVISGQLLRLRLNLAALDPRFLLHWIRSPYIERHIGNESVGSTRQSINSTILGNMPVPEVPFREQVKTAEVLDTLDTAIHKTEAIIAKLKAVKQGLLHDLLTRGIDPNGELRPPQAEALHLYKQSPLGWIPKEWRAESLADITTLVTSGSRGWAAHYSDVGALFVRSQNIRTGYLDLSDRQHVFLPMGGEGQRTRLESLDLLITITGNGVGNVAHIPDGWTEVAYVSQHVGLVRFLEPPLALLATQFLVQGAPGNKQLLDSQYGQSKPGLSLDNLRNLYIPVPPTSERELIVERLSCVQERVDEESRYASQLRELKSGLMDDLLTGRVRVTPLLAKTAQQQESA